MTGYFICKAQNLNEVRKDTKRAIQLGRQPDKIKAVAKVTLSKREFESYTRDFLVTHEFINTHTEKCTAKGGVWNCVIVTCRETGTRLAVNTEGFAYSRYVALVNE